MSLLKKNIAANFAGSVLQAILTLVFVPVYIKFMGVEAYGLIGIFVTLQVILSVLDAGLSSTLTREIARLSVLPDKTEVMHNTVHTLKIIYWGLSVAMGIAIVLFSSLIAHRWINAGQISLQTVEQSLVIMGFIIAVQMPAGFYAGGLMGLQKQVQLNVINTGVSILRGAGAVLLLWLVSPSIVIFFGWQFICSAMNTLLLGLLLRRGLPPCEQEVSFQRNILKDIWHFTAGISGITIIGIILSQLDKIILSKLISLEKLGYYMLASVVSMSLGRLSAPVFVSIYPKFTQLVSLGKTDELKALYHRSSQLMSVLIIPAAVILALFSYEIIFLWTQNRIMAGNSCLVVSILICGTALNGLMSAPYALQIACGWTRLSLLKNIISFVVYIPLMIYMATSLGVTGAAIVWVMLNMCDVLFVIPLMHQKLLPGEKWQWYIQDVGLPLLVSFGVAGLGRLLLAEEMSLVATALCLLFIATLTFTTTVVVMPATRAWLFNQGLRKI